MQKSELKSIKDAGFSPGNSVLLRLDLNVPCQSGVVENDFRIRKVFPTLEYLSQKGCRTVIISHLDSDSGNSLAPVFEYLKKYFSVSFVKDIEGARTFKQSIQDGEFLLVENIRNNKGEVENDSKFSEQLASLGDFYVNDAFSASHRSHASIVGVPRLLPSFAGFLMMDEIVALSSTLRPDRPSLFVLGGAKFNTKLPLLIRLLDRYDRIFIGGALANDVFRARGIKIGASLVSEIDLNLTVVNNHSNIRLPIDFVVQRGDKVFTQSAMSVLDNDRVEDGGPKTQELLTEFVNESKFILWNGPLGEYQRGFSECTESLARAVVCSSARSVIGGGDTIAVIEKMKILDRFGFVSTGGGAMLEYIATETLPGIEALKTEIL